MIPPATLVVAGVLYARYGFDGPFFLDPAVPVYGGQRLLEGVPPYASIFDHKGPLSPLIAGLGMALGRPLNAADLLSARLIFFALGCFTVPAVYLLGNEVFRSRSAGVFAALTLLGSYQFGSGLAWGPDAKTPAILFGTLTLLVIARKHWLGAGLMGALGALAWQPVGALVICGLVLALKRPKEERLQAALRLTLGALIPHALMVLYYLLEGALGDFLNGYILFNFLQLQRDDTSFMEHASHILKVVINGDAATVVPVFLGLITILGLAFQRPVDFRHLPLLLSLPVFAALSLLDFQQYADFKIFLPYAAVGFGGLLASVSLPGLSPGLLRAILGAGLLGLSVIATSASFNDAMLAQEGSLEEARSTARFAEERYGENVRIATIGAPQTMVLLDEKNPNRYLFFLRGIDSWVERTYPGGLDGWLADLEEYDPEVVAVGHTVGDHRSEILRWLESNYHGERSGGVVFFVRDAPQDQEAEQNGTGHSYKR